MKLDTTLGADLPVLTSARLVLRPLQTSDEGLLELYTSDARVAEGTRSIPHPLPPGATAQFIERATAPTREEDVWVMDGAGHDRAAVLGLISLKPLDRQQS